MKIQTILVPTDFSEHARRALDVAIDLAKTFGARVHVLHSYLIPIDGALPVDTLALRRILDQVRDVADEQLELARQQVVVAGVPCETTLVAQSPAVAIVETAEKIGADLIVMGTRGLTGLKHVVLGSVAERTVRLAPCPVLTLKAD